MQEQSSAPAPRCMSYRAWFEEAFWGLDVAMNENYEVMNCIVSCLK